MKNETRKSTAKVPEKPEPEQEIREQSIPSPQARPTIPESGDRELSGNDAASRASDAPDASEPAPVPDPAPDPLPDAIPHTPAPDASAEVSPPAPADPAPADSAAQSAGSDSPSPDAELERLREELNGLREQIARMERLGEEYAEFYELYPRTPIGQLPDSVWDDVRRGIPLAAAYALCEKKRARAAERAKEENERNRSRSAGSPDRAAAGEFSPAEVRAMSPAEVRKNYRQIMLSMQNWK